MNAAFPILGDASYVSYVGPLQHRGANTSTHLAEVRYPVQRMPVVSVVKLMPPDGLRICNEALAWLFLRGAGVSQAKHAAIMVLSEKKAVTALGRNLVTRESARDGHVLAWASHKLETQSLRVIFAGSEGDRKWAKLLCTVQGAAIAAFDETFFNIDRNLGNVLYVNDGACLPVDHEYIFGGNDWTGGSLNATSKLHSDSVQHMRRARQNNQLSQAEYQTACNHIVHLAHGHRHALDAARQGMVELVSRLYPDDAEALGQRVLSFVVERTASHWMEDRLGVV